MLTKFQSFMILILIANTIIYTLIHFISYTFILYAGTNNNMYYLQARENRRHRKLYLDNKRSKKKNTKYTVQNPSTPHVLKNTDNCNFLIFFLIFTLH